MKRVFILLLPLLLAVPAWAANPVAPEVHIKNMTNEALDIIRNDQALQTKGETKEAIARIDAKVLRPNFNFAHMTALSMGKEWRKATPEQRDILVNEFKTLLVRTYSNALTVYKNLSVKIKPARYRPTDTDVQIRTQVVPAGIKPVDIDYNLELIDNTWKVYDVVVEGVSLVTNYRGFFTQEVRKNGVEGAIRSLQAKNQDSEGQ